MTSGGSPAASRISTRRCAVCGTSSAGLKITAFPQASAGNIFQVGIAMGKLNGGINPALRRRHGALHILGPGTREAADDVGPVGGVAILEVGAGRWGDPFTGDEVFEIVGHQDLSMDRTTSRRLLHIRRAAESRAGPTT